MSHSVRLNISTPAWQNVDETAGLQCGHGYALSSPAEQFGRMPAAHGLGEVHHCSGGDTAYRSNERADFIVELAGLPFCVARVGIQEDALKMQVTRSVSGSIRRGTWQCCSSAERRTHHSGVAEIVRLQCSRCECSHVPADGRASGHIWAHGTSFSRS